MNNATSKELLVFCLKDKQGRSKRLFFSAPTNTTKEMSKEIFLTAEVLAENNYSLEVICQRAEEIAFKYNSVRVPH